ncbi:MAG: YggS family pyridoxal phosphate-dependent enzyme [Roseburia sp.]|nr:YggS family pyridoxal phosphate-dependent enzyme [Roseburia sp.]
MEIDELKRNIETAVCRVERAARAFGGDVTIVAATKTVEPRIISAAIALGVKNIGENRVQEYLEKRDAVTGADWHFIGTLQSNKAKYLVGNVALIQSVNSAALAAEIDRLACRRGVVQDVLIEVNVGGEAGKTGAPTELADGLIEYARSLKNISVCGLMAVPPRECGDDAYKTAYDIFDRNRADGFDILSVGMSGDYERAIAFGSNMVRLGTALFGARNYKAGN